MKNNFLTEAKYISLLSNTLTLFKNKGNNTYNFRCPICGDSKKDKLKTRGYIIHKEGTHFFKCHNCSASMHFDSFLKEVNPLLYGEFKLESISGNQPEEDKQRFKTDITKFGKRRNDKFAPLMELKKVSQLRYDHKAKVYVDKRKIENKFHHKLYYAPKFKEWINKHVPDKFANTTHDEGRLVIPFFDENGYVFAVQGRSLKPDSKIRYITVKFKDHDKIFGLERLNINRTFYICEGPIDSLFIPNCVAMAGSDTSSKYSTNSNAVFIYDNEPRSPEIVKKIERCISEDKKVVIWPDYIEEKDMNDMILAGIDSNDLKFIIKSQTFSGLKAKLEFTKWKKI